MGQNQSENQDVNQGQGAQPVAKSTAIKRDMSEYQISLFNGVSQKALYISVNNEIFDVSNVEQANTLFKDKIGKNTLVSQQELQIIRDTPEILFIGRLIQPLEFTLAELSKYTGNVSDENPSGRILLSAKGLVFDVTSGKSFYGPGCGYNRFAGKNAQRALALTSLKDDDLINTSLSDLQETELKTLEEWISKYHQKYPHVGYLKE